MSRLLYVEDDPINALVMKKLMAPYFEIVHVPDGESCLQTVMDDSYDLILMDINLGRGKMDGIETMKRLHETNSSFPIIAVTSYAMPEDEDRFMKEGFHGYVAKPIEQQKLLSYLQRFLN